MQLPNRTTTKHFSCVLLLEDIIRIGMLQSPRSAINGSIRCDSQCPDNSPQASFRFIGCVLHAILLFCVRAMRISVLDVFVVHLF